MIIDRDVHPDRNLFHIGARVLQLIKEHQFGVIPMMDLFERTKNVLECSISFDDFILSLDWLFILGTIDSNETGDIIRCF